MPRRDRKFTLRVGLLVLVAMAALAFGVFLIGEQNNLFRSMNSYTVELESVTGLQAGNPVQLDGVDVGRVSEIILPIDPADTKLSVEIAVDSRYAARIRGDSVARIKTLGLLGDKYVELSSGTPEAEVLPDGGEIPASPPTNVDQLISSGEDAVENFVGISVSLSKILERLERGEGMLGELMVPLPEAPTGPPLYESLPGTLASLDRIGRQLDTSLQSGEGPLPRLLNDRAMGIRLARTIERLDRLTETFEGGDGLVPALLHDAETKERFQATLTNLETTSEQLIQTTAKLDQAEGLLPRLLYDDEYADELTGQIEDLIENLNRVSGQLAEGDGTAGRLLQDDSVYEAVQDILVGIDENRLLRWLIRNRQKKGIEVRYEQERAAAGVDEAEAGETRDPVTGEAIDAPAADGAADAVSEDGLPQEAVSKDAGDAPSAGRVPR